MIYSCERESKPVTNVDLLTDNSAKTWYLSKILTQDSISIVPPSCLIDDENKFKINGECLINNMGTVYSQGSSDFSGQPSCKDTVDIIDTATWALNLKMDTLTVTTRKYVLTGKIIKFTRDSLIIKRTYSNTVVQTEYYGTKKK